MRVRDTSLALVLGLFACVSMLTTPAHAQRAQAEDDPFAGVEEMIVTGSGTAALLAPASTSAVAFDPADLESYGVEDMSDLAAYVPNLEIRSQNATNASFFVRGVGLQDFGANASSSVPIFQDGIPRNPSATQLVGLFDIGGLSVLKGPQGSGNFRNASAGAFLVNAVKPEPEFTGYSKVTLSRIVSVDARDANRYAFETAISAPIFDDWISARLSARYSHENPFWENGCTNRTARADRPFVGRPADGGVSEAQASICGERIQRRNAVRDGISNVAEFLPRYIGEVDDFAFRGQVRLAPPDTPLDLTFRLELSRLNRDSTAGQHIGTGLGLGGQDSGPYQDPDNTARENEIIAILRPLNPGLNNTALRRLALVQVGKEILKRPLDEHPYRGDLDRPGRLILETYAASLSGILDLDLFDIELQAGFVDYRKSEIRDTDLSPNVRFPSQGNDQAWETYVDLKVKGESIGDVPLEWDVGFYNMIEQVEAFQRQDVFEIVRRNDFQQEIYSLGVYAQGRYEFLEAFTLAAGLRYNWEQKDFEVFEGSSPPTSTFQIFETSRNQRTWDAITGFGEIAYEFSEDVRTYLKYSRGFKAGHFNPSSPTDAKIPGRGFADPEQIDAFEWGIRFAAWAGRVTGTSNLFYYNYKNYQVFRLTTDVTGVFRAIQNAEKARNYGAELELVVSPLEGYVPEAIEGLRIKFLFGWLETNYVEFTNAEQRPFAGGNIGVSIDYSGNPLISAPGLQISTTFTWPLVLGRLGTITPQYDFTWTDDTPFDPNRGRGEVLSDGTSQFSPFLIGNRAYVLHNVRLSWSPPGESGLTVAGWCRNVTDQRYKTFSVDISTFAGQILNFVADPRICGAEARFTW